MIKHRNIKPWYTPIPKVDMSPRQHDDKSKLPPVPVIRKGFQDTAFGRTLLGKNGTGEIIHGIIDILPIPNVHEIVKRVAKDADAQGIEAGYTSLIIETARRLDWTRTLIALAGAVLLIKGSEWTGIDLTQLIELFERISGIL